MPAQPIRRTALTGVAADAFDRDLAALAAAAAPDLVLDLSAVESASSTGLAGFVRLDREVRSGGGRLSLVNLRPAVRRVFAAVRLGRLLGARPAA